MTPPRDPIFTPRLQLGFGLIAFGIGLMFLCGKVVSAPIPGGIAAGIAGAFTGLVVIVVEALRDEPTPPDGPPTDEEAGRRGGETAEPR